MHFHDIVLIGFVFMLIIIIITIIIINIMGQENAACTFPCTERTRLKTLIEILLE